MGGVFPRAGGFFVGVAVWSREGKAGLHPTIGLSRSPTRLFRETHSGARQSVGLVKQSRAAAMLPNVGELVLRVSTVTNVRNLALLAAIALLAVTTLITPRYRTLTHLPPISSNDPAQAKVLSNDFVISLYKQLLAVKEELDAQKRDLGKMASIERDLCDKRFNELRGEYESQFQREHLAGRQAIELYQGIVEKQQQMASEAEQLSTEFSQLLQLNHSLHFQVEAAGARTADLQRQCVNQLEVLKTSHERDCSAQYEQLVEECSLVQNQLNLALTANKNLNASSHETISSMGQQLSECNEQLRSQMSVLDSRLSDANLQRLAKEAVASSADAHVCPQQKSELSDKLCQDMCQAEITRRMAGVERRVDRAAEVEAQLYHYDVDYALASAGTKVVRNLTSPTYLPPPFRLSSLLKQGMASVGLEGLASTVPEISGEKVLTHLGLPMGRGEPVEALDENMNLGSCWAMQVRLSALMRHRRSRILFLISCDGLFVGTGRKSNHRAACSDHADGHLH